MRSAFGRPFRPVRLSSPADVGWGVVAALVLAVTAAAFTLANGQNALGVVVDGSGLDLSSLWPLTAASAFVTELLGWFLMITRPSRPTTRRALATGVVVGVASHLPLAVAAAAVVPIASSVPPLVELAFALFGSLYFAVWFSVPASVVVTVGVLRVARRR